MSMFFPNEIQLLISGGINEIDIEDLQKNTKYNRFKPEKNPEEAAYLEAFWEYLNELPNDQKEKFLSFVTGADRPPLLGFKFLYPPFCLSKLDIDDPNNLRFPTASTCANMVHLPYYGSSPEGLVKMRKVMTEAIN